MAIMRPTVMVSIAAAFLFALACNGGDDPEATSSPDVQPSAQPSGQTPASGAVMDLASGASTGRIIGADSGDYLNDLPLLATGDVNGDGLDDLLIGARFGDGPENTRTDSGEAYIIYGRTAPIGEIDLAQGQADVTIFGANGHGSVSQQGDQLGYAGALGDINGDRIDDIALGAPLAGRVDTRSPAGAAFVILGRSDLPAEIDLSQNVADLTILGTHANGLFGDAIITGDVDGDGDDELFIGAPFQPRPSSLANSSQLAGAVFMFRGDAQFGGSRDIAKGEYDAAIYGVEEFDGGDEVGDMLATGDLNDDGLADLVITAEAADGPDNERSVAAEAYVVFGSSDMEGVLDLAEGAQDVTVFGADANDTTGFNLSTGDVTGDGVDDLLVSLRGGDGAGNNLPEAGEVHIFPGPSIPSVIDLASYDEDSFVSGADPADFLGNGIAVADWDGDGVNELILGSPMGEPENGDPVANRDMGEVWLVDARGIDGGVPVSSTPVRLSISGVATEDGLGQSVAVGDLDGNGRPDLVMLAMRADRPDGSAPDSGVIYIVSP
jgi:hypothetical protein